MARESNTGVIAKPIKADCEPSVRAARESNVKQDGIAWPHVEVAWPCRALQIDYEPYAGPKSGEHEQELLDRYLKSDLVDEEGATAATAVSSGSVPPEVAAEISLEEARMKADMMDENSGMDSDADDGDEAGVEWLSRFQRRLERSPEQVVRYAWGGSPLWMRPPPAEANGGSWPPPCPRCGAGRVFELQLLPTLLSQADAAAQRQADWGTVLVYTCSKDCAAREEMDDVCEEFVVVQPAV
jgi:hypothetical protein